MDIHARLVEVVAGARSAADALASATRVVAEALPAEACTIFVRDQNRLAMRAHFGPTSEASAITAGEMLAKEALRKVHAVTDEAAGEALLAVPVASVNQAIGAIVARRASTSPFTSEEVMRLSGVGSQMVELIASARVIETLEGQHTGARRDDRAPEPPSPREERALRGV
ncbi:MAG: Phosphoenolpyruvate-protein phosphotransferase of system, partial [Labilithrix sp.]|nr:Phosphoenolpyruvate-protein phosphotransferase of system [Labilithrix sp.]